MRNRQVAARVITTSGERRDDMCTNLPVDGCDGFSGPTALQPFLQEPVPHRAEISGRVAKAKPFVESLRAVVIFSNL
jgi:hypothetical protein